MSRVKFISAFFFELVRSWWITVILKANSADALYVM